MKPGDTVAVISPSAGGPFRFPHVYEAGLASLRALGLVPIDMINTRTDGKVLHDNPEQRADDLNQAFADSTVRGIFASTGGDDSVRILPYLDTETILQHPKVLMGLSDVTTLLAYLSSLGLVTLYGPNVMVGLAQMTSLPKDFMHHLHTMLTADTQGYEYHPYSCWSDGYPDWREIANAMAVKSPTPNDHGWRWLQGRGVTSGSLWGGCIEVLEMMKGTAFWPSQDFWNGKVLFLETSEEKPSFRQVKYMLRNYGMQGVFDRSRGLLIGRARDYTKDEKSKLEQTIVDVVGGEFRRPDLPVVANMDFGHTDPQLVLPLGITVEIDCDRKRITLRKSALGIT